MTDFGNRRWPALPKVSQQRGDELRTEPRELTRGRTRPARVSRTVFRIQKSPYRGVCICRRPRADGMAIAIVQVGDLSMREREGLRPSPHSGQALLSRVERESIRKTWSWRRWRGPFRDVFIRAKFQATVRRGVF